MDEGHEILMQHAFDQLARDGLVFNADVDPNWLTLGNVRTDLPALDVNRRVSIFPVLKLLVDGFLCSKADHPRHAMRCKHQAVPDAYQQMIEILRRKMIAGCDATQSWEARALIFGSAMHTLQDSYCIAHALRVDNGDPHAAVIDMYTWPSREHPFTTQKDAVWADASQTALRKDAAAAVVATVAALKIFIAQDVALIDAFLDQYVSFREDIAAQRHPEYRKE